MKAAASRTAFAACLLAMAAAGPAQAGKLPPWLRVADLRRAPVHAIPPISAARLKALEADNEPWVERLLRFDYDLRADGVVEQRIVHARQLLTAEGVREAGTLALSARAATDRVFLEEAYVLSPTGRRLPFDPKTLQISTTDDEDLFHDVWDVTLPFANLEPHSTVVISFRVERDNRRWPLPWSALHDTQHFAPMERLEVDVRWAAGRTAPTWKTDDPKLACRTGDRRVTCSRQMIEPIPSDPDVASWPDVTPQIAIADPISWPALVATERKLLDPGDSGAAVAQTAARLVAGVDERNRRIEALLRFVADDIRYVGFEHGRSAVTPHAPAVTLARRFGDCKDKVALFLALARRAGFDAYPVLVATDRREKGKLLLPSWKYFDHIIACVAPPKGIAETPVCLDPTTPNLSAGTLPFGVRNAVGVPLVPGGEPGPLTTGDGLATYGWQVDYETKNEVACDGAITETLVRRFRGAGAGTMRGKLRAENVADRTRWLENAYTDVMGKKFKPTVSVDGLDAPGAPVEFRSTNHFTATRGLAAGNEWTDSDPWLVDIGHEFQSENRHHPYVVSGLYVTSVSNYEFCPAFRPRFASPELAFESEFGSLTREHSRVGGRPQVKTVLRIPPQTIAPDKLARFNKFMDVVLGQTGIWYTLERAR